MKLKVIKLLLNICFLTNHLYSQFDTVFNVDHPARTKMILEVLQKSDYIHHPDSARIKLENLKTLSIQHKDLQSLLLYELYSGFIGDLNSTELQEKAFASTRSVIQRAQEENFILVEIYALVSMGDILGDAGRTGASISYYLKVYELADKVDQSYLPRSIQSMDYFIGYTYFIHEDFQKAKFYIERSFVGSKNWHFVLLMNDVLSQINLKLGDYERSEYHINEAKKIYMNADPKIWWHYGWDGIFEGNHAKILYFKKEYNKAIPGLIRAIQITEKANMYDNVATFGLLLIDCYLRTGQTSEARSLMPKVRDAIYKKGTDWNNRDLYRLMSILPEEPKQIEKINLTLDSLTYWNEKIKSRMETDSQIQKDMEYELAQWKKKDEELQQKIKNQLFYRTVLWIALGVLITLACVVIYRKQNQLITHKKTTQQILDKSEMELYLARKELEEFKKGIIEKNKRIEILEAGNEQTLTDAELETLRTNTILTDNDWNQFKQLFEKAHVGYLQRLKNKFPDLTAGEIRFIVLIKLSLNNKEMASTLGVSTGAIRTMKSRLLKKINLDESDNLEELINLI